ncbi:hypothetical protein [Natronolimnohabitans innermongolicus]|uniref:Uncharacterized protein n=1 Tax=Natronolimnohabitans innermongolicus JCM 12255 TaxID=1227499 RepID=L9XHX2_9EURY|nr:hypothetical protein [Natronolimnohabitans innermongolicus]ELY61207.1 hypothetical protein C493_02798 [Natronolimnohabitans innermongolicus JCM 12255]
MRLTRRQAIAGAGGALAVGTATGVAAGNEEPVDAVVEADRNGEHDYPRCLYKPNDDGEWRPLLPINVHARASGESSALEAVDDAFSGLGALEWTPVFPDATAKAWDPDEDALVAPDYSYRRPRLGDEWNHVHIWGVDDDRVAIHAHLDVIDLAASHFHRGDHYGDAADEVVDHLLDEGWTAETPYEIDYGVDDDRLERWVETGDAKLRY